MRVGLVSTAFPVLCCSLASEHGCASFTVMHQLVAAVGRAPAREIYSSSIKKFLKIFLVLVSMIFESLF